jgi:hypothetical protein
MDSSKTTVIVYTSIKKWTSYVFSESTKQIIRVGTVNPPFRVAFSGHRITTLETNVR